MKKLYIVYMFGRSIDRIEDHARSFKSHEDAVAFCSRCGNGNDYYIHEIVAEQWETRAVKVDGGAE